jgi:hypothetical protein
MEAPEGRRNSCVKGVSEPKTDRGEAPEAQARSTGLGEHVSAKAPRMSQFGLTAYGWRWIAGSAMGPRGSARPQSHLVSATEFRRSTWNAAQKAAQNRRRKAGVSGVTLLPAVRGRHSTASTVDPPSSLYGRPLQTRAILAPGCNNGYGVVDPAACQLTKADWVPERSLGWRYCPNLSARCSVRPPRGSQ